MSAKRKDEGFGELLGRFSRKNSIAEILREIMGFANFRDWEKEEILAEIRSKMAERR